MLTLFRFSGFGTESRLHYLVATVLKRIRNTQLVLGYRVALIGTPSAKLFLSSGELPD